MIYSNNTFQLCISIIVSFIIIYIIQYIFNYFIYTYSIPKSKDLVNTQLFKYKKMIAELQQNNKNNKNEDESDINMADMNADLLEYMEQQME